jgi:hypothetical protein
MSVYIDTIKGGIQYINATGRATEDYRIYLHKEGSGEILGTTLVDKQGNYQLNTQEIILKNFKNQTINVVARETADNENFSDWSLSKAVYIF